MVGMSKAFHNLQVLTLFPICLATNKQYGDNIAQLCSTRSYWGRVMVRTFRSDVPYHSGKHVYLLSTEQRNLGNKPGDMLQTRIQHFKRISLENYSPPSHLVLPDCPPINQPADPLLLKTTALLVSPLFRPHLQCLPLPPLPPDVLQRQLVTSGGNRLRLVPKRAPHFAMLAVYVEDEILSLKAFLSKIGLALK